MKEETLAWLDKAEEDVSAAQVLVDSDLLSPAMFHAQQSIEKALKSVLVEATGRIPRTHDLVLLAEETKAPSAVAEACRIVSPGYTLTRYPDTDFPVTEERAEEFVRLAREVLDWVRRRLS